MKTIELLSPAKNLECGIAAINHGADAVYIGASQFGARAAAGNPVSDIETLSTYAHRYRSKVFVALNTVLTDEQLPQVERLIRQVYEAGADALIVQDMGILQFQLPPIALHASTQTDNRSIEKVKFLQDAGFSRVVLARELTLHQISEISAGTRVELEAFVHGALCVSYSGQCYMSEASCGRSANRGECAQYCRLPYSLTDADGNMLVRDKHLLSLKDLDLSESLPEMIEAGIMSFKIEGRLKDADYVKNITAFYRKKLDALIDNDAHLKRSSSGKTHFLFEPQPEKSFRRGNTDYFLHGRHRNIILPDTPKSMGEPIGKITKTSLHYFETENGQLFHNGDGACFISPNGELGGFRINKTENGKIYPLGNIHPELKPGILIYRNQDKAFDDVLKGKTSERKVNVKIELHEHTDGFLLKLTDEDSISVKEIFNIEKTEAKNKDGVIENITRQLSKLGNTIYQPSEIIVHFSKSWFIPSSALAEWRRLTTEKLDNERMLNYKREAPRRPDKEALYFERELTYLGNVTNRLAENFYRQHGVTSISQGFEIKHAGNVPLMFTKHCIKYEMGWCPKEGAHPTFREPLYLEHKNLRYRLQFDCAKCEMQILKD